MLFIEQLIRHVSKSLLVEQHLCPIRKLLYIWCYLFTKLFAFDTILVSSYVHMYYTQESASI